MCAYVILNILLIYAANIQAIPEGSCELKLVSDVDRFSKTKGIQWGLPKHLYLDPDQNSEFLENGKSLTLECKYGFLDYEFTSPVKMFQCINGKYNKKYYYKDLLCRNEYHKNVVVSKKKRLISKSDLLKCEKPLKIYQVGVRKNGNIDNLYTVCYNERKMKPLFTYQPFKQNLNLGRTRSTNSRDDDVWGFDAYGRTTEERKNLSKAYVKSQQKETMTQFEGSEYRYPYFNRGHFVPYADFEELEDQKATMEYINVGPQWEKFNKAGWSRVEQEARNVRQINPDEWETYTGIFGLMKNESGSLIFLSEITSDRFKEVVFIPTLYWKIVYNVNDETKSRVFVGINDPRINPRESFTDQYELCSPIVDSLTNKRFEGDESKGFTYECTAADFLASRKISKVCKKKILTGIVRD